MTSDPRVTPVFSAPPTGIRSSPPHHPDFPSEPNSILLINDGHLLLLTYRELACVLDQGRPTRPSHTRSGPVCRVRRSETRHKDSLQPPPTPCPQRRAADGFLEASNPIIAPSSLMEAEPPRPFVRWRLVGRETEMLRSTHLDPAPPGSRLAHRYAEAAMTAAFPGDCSGGMVCFGNQRAPG